MHVQVQTIKPSAQPGYNGFCVRSVLAPSPRRPLARWPAIVLLYVREMRLTAESGGAGGQFIEATARRRALPLGGTASVSSRRDTPRC